MCDGLTRRRCANIVRGDEAFDASFFGAISEDADYSEVATLEALHQRSLKKHELGKNLRERRRLEVGKRVL